MVNFLLIIIFKIFILIKYIFVMQNKIHQPNDMYDGLNINIFMVDYLEKISFLKMSRLLFQNLTIYNIYILIKNKYLIFQYKHFLNLHF